MNIEPHQLLNLSSQTALVTGAARGIGEAIATRFCEAGAAVVLVDSDLEEAQRVEERLRAKNHPVLAVRANVADTVEAKAAVAAAVEKFGRIDILVNNAGIFPFSPVLETSEALWDRVLDINLKGAFFMAQATAQFMRKQNRGGSIVNIASVDALHPTGALAHYDASKGGLVMLTKSLALELAALGIRVNSICPGGIDTPGAKQATRQMATTSQQADAFTARIPLRRMGTPDEIACAALFFASTMASYVTGSNLVVDGGYLIS